MGDGGLSTETAAAIVDAALAEGRRRELHPLCVAVLDERAGLLVLKREEAASSGRPKIAAAKAAGCLAMGMGGRDLARRAAAAPAFFASLAGVLREGIVPAPGGVLVRSASGRLLAAVGVSGDTSDNDEACALAGIAAVGLLGDTG
jgi:uncharacterized protein GlcG (DUF336 family)